MAGADQDCLTSRDKAARIQACTEVIEGASFNSQQKALAFRERGRARLDAGALGDALADLNEALRVLADDAVGLVARGQVHLSRNDSRRALADFDAALKIDRNNADVLVLRGHTHLLAGNPRKAIEDFNAVLAIEPGRANALNNRGLAYRRAGDVDRAITDFTAAITANPSYAIAFNNRGYAYETKGLKAEAIADFRRALTIDPGLAGARNGLKRLGEAGHSDESAAYAHAGQQIVEKNCGWCHATGRGGASPNAKAPPFRELQRRYALQALREPLSRGIAAPHDQMPKFDFTDDEIDRIIAYINALAYPATPSR
jgi:tetratricopeptide (TPR) repeat protein